MRPIITLAATALLAAACGSAAPAGPPSATTTPLDATASPSAITASPSASATPVGVTPAPSTTSSATGVPPAAATAPPASTPTAGASQTPQAVTIADFAFEPATLEVPVGTVVRWTNADSFGHTVTSGEDGSDDGRFDSQALEPGDEFEVVFDTAGSYSYFCDFHPNMTGVIEVVP